MMTPNPDAGAHATDHAYSVCACYTYATNILLQVHLGSAYAYLAVRPLPHASKHFPHLTVRVLKRSKQAVYC